MKAQSEWQVGSDKREERAGGVLDDTHQVAGNHGRLKIADGHIFVLLRTYLRIDEERLLGDDVNVVEGRRLREFLGRNALACLPEGADGLNAFVNVLHGADV